MSNGIWVSDNQFIKFAESRGRLSDHIVTRDRSPDFSALGNLLPNPDPILKAQRKDISVYRGLLSDAIVGGAVRRRKSAVVALEHGLEQERSSARITKRMQAVFDDLDLQDIIRSMIDASLFGFQPMEVMWANKDGWTVPVDLVAKPPEWFVFDADGELRFRSRDALLEGEVLPPRKILLVQHDASYANPWGEADLAKCFWPATFKRGGLKFWVQFAEKYGTPWLIGKVPRNTTGGDKQELLADLDAMVQDAIAVVPDDSSVEIAEATSKTGAAEAYKELLMYCRSELHIALLGQNQSSEASSTHASAKSGLEVADELRDGLARMVCGAFNDLIGWIMDVNAVSGPAPKFNLWEQSEVDDKQAKRDKTLSDSGVRFSKKYWMRSYDLREDDIDDVVPPDQLQGNDGIEFAEAGANASDEQELLNQLADAGNDPLRVWIEQIRTMADKADSLEQLRDQLLDAYGDLDGTDLSAVMEAAFTLASAKGHEQVLDEAGMIDG